jgi:hypothetical protein
MKRWAWVVGIVGLCALSASAAEKKKQQSTQLVPQVGAGIEDYFGSLSDQIRAGPTWNLAISSPTDRMFGAEVGYSGAVNQIEVAGDGPNITRQGGYAALMVGAPLPFVQPYLMSGIAFDHYFVPESAQALGYDDDWSGRVPFAGGLRLKLGMFNADARFTYSQPFNQDFAAFASTGADALGEGDRNNGFYQGTVQVGAAF